MVGLMVGVGSLSLLLRNKFCVAQGCTVTYSIIESEALSLSLCLRLTRQQRTLKLTTDSKVGNAFEKGD